MSDVESTRARGWRARLALGRHAGLLALLLPLVTALRLRSEVGDDPFDRMYGTELLVGFFGPYLALLAFLLGASATACGGREGDSPTTQLRASTARLLALLVVASVSFVLVCAPDLTDTGGPGWTFISWVVGLGLPLWGLALRLRMGGATPLRVVLGASALVVLGSLSLLLLALGFVLRVEALSVPLSASGVVFGTGACLAAWRRVSAPDLLLAAALGAVSLAAALGICVRLVHPPADAIVVYELLDLDPATDRVVFRVAHPAASIVGVSEIDLRSGTVWDYPRTCVDAIFAGQQRVAAKEDLLAFSLGLEGALTFCRSGTDEAPESRRCGPRLSPGRGLILRGHPAKPWVLGAREDAVVAWDLDSDRHWSVDEVGSKVLWPCFTNSGGVYWRLQQTETPYPERLRPMFGSSSGATTLDPEHAASCIGEVIDPVGVFRRGRKRLGRAGLLVAPGLPAAGVAFEQSVVAFDWSGDGQTLVLQLEGREYVYYSPEWGLRRTGVVSGAAGLSMSPGGKRLAVVEHLAGGGLEYRVHSVPGHEVVTQGQTDSNRLFWVGDETLVLIDRGRLLAVDVVAGESRSLFPPEASAP